MDRIVIIGSGQGGLQVAMSLRQEGYEGEIRLIGAEKGLPYQRPPLSKAYLKTGNADAIRLRPASFYENKKIILNDGVRIDRIDRETRTVHSADARYQYDHLILATGTRNLRPPIPGVEAALDLRTLEDASTLRQTLSTGSLRCAVIGGGFIGLEFAAVARGMGHSVTVAEAAQRLMARVISPPMSARFQAKHEALGATIHLGNPVHEVLETGIALKDGTRIDADVILLAAGVRPNDELAQAAGLATDNGVLVNERLLTEDDSISALGDCAAFPNPVNGQSIRLESVQAATDHARLIAKRLAKGEQGRYNAVPWFWSDQSDYKLQIAGLAGSNDDAVLRDDGAVFRFNGDLLSAVETINDAKTHMKARKCLAGLSSDQVVTREALQAADLDIAALLA